MAKKKSKGGKAKRLGRIIAAAPAPVTPTKAPGFMPAFKEGGVVPAFKQYELNGPKGTTVPKASAVETVKEAVKDKASKVMGYDKRKEQMDALGLKRGGVVNRHGVERDAPQATQAAAPKPSLAPPPAPAAPAHALRAAMVKRSGDAALPPPRRAK